MTPGFTTEFLHKEIRILEELVEVLMKPKRYNISDKDLFTLLNRSSSSTDQLHQGGVAMGLSASINSTTSALRRSVANDVSTKMIDFKNLVALGQLLTKKETDLMAIDTLMKTLSSHVYINHLSTMKQPQNMVSMSHDYFPDLRLVLKNVLVLFINFFKRFDELLKNDDDDDDADVVDKLQDLMLLLNVSILNKLIMMFKVLNPEITLKNENVITGDW